MRALSDAEKAERRDALAAVASRLFAELGYAGLTMDAVAKAAGVAKGTVFLTFATKEDLILHAAAGCFDAWFDRLESIDPGRPTAELAALLHESIVFDPLLMPLMALVGPVLEQGCSAGAVVRFKENLNARMLGLAQTWVPRRPAVPPEAWRPLFSQIHAVIVGAWTVGEVPQNIRAALADRPDLLQRVPRFDALVVPMLAAQLRAILGE